MARRGAGKLGEILLATSLITAEQLDRAVAAQGKTKKRLGQILIEQGAASEDDVAWALSNQLMYPYVFLRRETVDDEAVGLLPEAFLREHHVLPIHRFDQQVTLAMADPTDDRTVDEVVTQTGLQVNRAVALESNIAAVLRQLTSSERRPPRPRAQGQEAQYFRFHLLQALEEGASEIHFDGAVNGQHRVRYRIHDVLVDRAGHPAALHVALIRHLREFAGLLETPSAAAATTVTVGDAQVRALVTVVPAAEGPAAQIALYPCRAGVPDLLPLGVDVETTRAFRGVVERRRGALVIGCADPLVRTMLIRAALAETPRRKVWALEVLPVYRSAAITQTAIESSAQATALLGGAFAAGADVIAVDDATQATTLRAALECARARTVVAGHPQDDVVGLVAHVIEAAGPALATATLNGVLAARKIRLLCPECKERLRSAAGAAGGRYTFTARGCAPCGFTGYRGYRVLTAVWLLGADGRARLRSGSPGNALTRLAPAVASSMREQAHALVDDGLTSIDELSRVLEEF